MLVYMCEVTASSLTWNRHQRRGTLTFPTSKILVSCPQENKWFSWNYDICHLFMGMCPHPMVLYLVTLIPIDFNWKTSVDIYVGYWNHNFVAFTVNYQRSYNLSWYNLYSLDSPKSDMKEPVFTLRCAIAGFRKKNSNPPEKIIIREEIPAKKSEWTKLNTVQLFFV